MLNSNPLTDIWFANIFSCSVCCFFTCWWFLLLWRSFLVWCSPTCLFFLFCCLCFRCHIQKIITKTHVKGLIVGVLWFQVLHLSPNPFWVNFCEGKIWIQFHSFTCEYSIIPAPSIKQTCLFSIEYSWLPCEISAIYAWIYFWALDFVPLMYLSVFLPVLYLFDDYSFIE